MARSPFGWSLPPGCTLRHIEEAYGGGQLCAVCFMDPADCICPECPTCGSNGDPDCYRAEEGHGLKLSREQVVSRTRARVTKLRQDVLEEEQVLNYVENGGEYSPDIEDNPDPWS